VAAAHGQATNVLVNDVGNINICDFGLSQLKLDMKRKSKDSGDIADRGTMRWLSPERMQGGQLTWKCDVYSFGMVIYEVSPISILTLTCRSTQRGQFHSITLTMQSFEKISCVSLQSCETDHG
jgi:serine/threonine protein kinase